MLLAKKVALVVGVKNDIGRTTAEIVAEEGARVVVAERNSTHGKAVVDKIIADGGEAIYQSIDITLNRSQKALIDRITAEYGRLDVAFNNVSVDGDYFPLAQQSEDMVAGIIDVNFNGMWLSLKYQIEQMLKNDGGAIVNNVSSFKNDGSAGCSMYKATKSAVKAMSQAAALEYAANNIRINTITPGIVKRSHSSLTTDNINPNLNNCVSPQQIAKTVAWLCSNYSSGITGHNLPINGSYSRTKLD